MLRLNNIAYSNDGKKINYDYVVDKKYKKYFSNSNAFYAEYDVDVSSVPYSIAVIPFLSSVMPIAWFLGFDVQVGDVDKSFFDSLNEIKSELSKDWRNKHLHGELKAKNIVNNTISGSRYLMLYSGGVDAFTTYLRHREQNPDLVTILGADIPIDDIDQWEDLLRFINAEKLLVQNNKYHVKCNFRDFYTYKVDLLVDVGWWGKVQHGLALLGVHAPLSFVNGYKGIYIASSQVDGFAWGSQPKTDNKVRWADLFCKNDGSELNRQKKVDLIVDFKQRTKSPVKVRVCYSELNEGLNCSRCEKCYRTILAIIFAGDDPNKYGFSVNGKIYDQVFDHFDKIQTSDIGLVNLWKDIEDKAKSDNRFFVFEDKQKESASVQRIASGELTGILTSKLNKNTQVELLKFVLINKFKYLYRSYRFIKKIFNIE
jgi:hypothetical protein